MPIKRTASGRGGPRPGAGRKPFLKRRRRVGVDLEGPDFDQVQKLAKKRGVSVSQVVRDAVRAYLKGAKRS